MSVFWDNKFCCVLWLHRAQQTPKPGVGSSAFETQGNYIWQDWYLPGSFGSALEEHRKVNKQHKDGRSVYSLAVT